MKDPKDFPPDFTDLRRRAEEQLAAEAIPPEDLSPDQAARLIQQLRVHQIELEMQNDELRRSQAFLEEYRSKYAELYDFAPMGYLTLDNKGRIVEANLTAATLLGVERSKLLNRFFPHFLVDADRRVFRQLLNSSLNQTERRGEFHFQDSDGNMRVMLLDIFYVTDAESRELRRVSLTDITELKRVQEELRLHKEELEELVAERTAELIQANEQFREANEQLEALFAAAPLVIGVFDNQGRTLQINPAAERIFGWSQVEQQGRPPLSMPSANSEESQVVLQEMIQGKYFTGFEIKQQRKDGTLIDASLSAAPLYNAQGKFRGFVGLAEDITTRKKLEEDVRTQAQVLASMAEGVAVTDSRGTIIYANPAFEAMFGYEPGEMVGLHSNVLNFYPPEENLAFIKEILDQVNTSGLWTGEFHNCRKDGQPFFTLTRISTLKGGGKKLYISVQEDITERKRAQEMLQRQAELLDLAHDAILVRDLVGRISYWNQGATELCGWTREEALGQVSHQLLQTSFPQPLLDIERQVFEQGHWEGELIYTTRDGRRLIVDSRWNLKKDEAGQPLAILEINRDITTRRQAEAALKKSQERFRRLVDANVVGLAVSDEEKIIDANNEFLRLVGYTREEMLAGAIKWVEMTPRESIPQDARALHELRTAGSHTTFEKTFLRKDGSQVPVVVGGALLEEEPISWVSFVLDITDRKRLENSLRLSEARFRAIFTNASIGIATTDLTGRLQEFNSPVMKGLGYTPTELKGMSFQDITYPDDLGVDLELFQELAAGKRDRYQVEKRFVRQGGRVLWGRLHVSLVRGPAGEPQFTVALVEDITARKEFQAALGESEARYRSLVELSPDAILVHGKGRYVFANPVGLKLFGAASPQEIIGRRVLELVHPDSLETVRRRVDTGERLDLREVKILRLDGQPVEVEVAATPIRYGGQPAVQVVVRDITERRQTERAIRRLASFPELNPNPVLEVDEDGAVTYANPAARQIAKNLGLIAGVQAYVPSTLKEIFAAAREGGPRQYSFDLSLKGARFAITLHLPYDLPIARLYALDNTKRKSAEEALARKQAEFAAIFNAISDGIVFTDTQRHIALVNPAAEALFGYAPEEMQGRLTEFLYASRADFEEQGRHRYHLQSDQPQSVYEITYRRKDGSVFPAEARGSQVKDAHDRILGYVSINRDINERKAAEEALRESEERFRLSFENANLGMALVGLDGKYLRVNDALSRMLGYRRDELEHMGVRDITYPDDLPLSRDFLRRTLRGEIDSAHLEKRKVHKNGDLVWVHVASSLVHDAQGKPLYFISQIQDITARKQAETALRESREDLDRAQAVAHIGSWRLDVGHNELTWSEETHRIFGIPQGTPLTYEAFLAAVHHEDRESVDRSWTAALQGEPYDIEHRILVDGAVKWVRELAELEFDQDGQMLGGFGTVQDVTARKQAEAALAESEARFRNLFEHMTEGVVLHEVVYDEQGSAIDYRILAANPAYAVHTGLDPDQVRGRLASEVYGTEEAPYLETFARVAYTRQPEQFETYFVPMRRHFAISVTSPRSGHFVTVFEDITRRKEMEEALRRSNRCLDLLVDTAGQLLAEGSSPEVLISLCRKVMDFLDCDTFFNYLVTHHTPNGLRLNAHAGLTEAEAQSLRWVDFGMAVCGCAARDGCPIVCEEILDTEDPRTKLIKPLHLQAYACHPLIVGGKVLGTLSFGSRRRTGFSPDDLALMKALADQVAIAMDRQLAEEALRESEARYRAIGELIPFGIWTTMPDGGWEYVSKSFLKMTGKTLEECQGYGWMYLLPQEDIKPTLEAWQYCRQTGGFWDYEFKIRGADGRYHTILSRGLPLSDDQGHITSWVGINLDISARQKMEEALRRAKDDLEARVEERTAALSQANEQLLQEIEERQKIEDQFLDSEARFLAFMEHLPGLAAMRDMEGRYLFANLAWEETMGLEHGSWRGKTLADLWAPERAAVLQSADFDIISSGMPTEEMEVQVLADGPHHFLTKRFPILDAAGLPYMVGAIAIDVTDRQRAEQQVAETGRLYRVLSQVNEAIMRGRDQKGLFDQVCRIVVEEGLFRLAWVGLTDAESHTVRVAARYGFGEGYLDNLAVSVREGAQSQGPTGTAIRENRYDICNDFTTDPRMAPWREQALDRDYRSSGAFPLRLGSRVVGAISLYASRPEFFTTKEIELLTSLADNLSFALESLDREAKRLQAEADLKVSEGKLRYLAEQLLTAQENERKRLAAELHDELGHALLALKLHLSSIAKKIGTKQKELREEILAQLNYINVVIKEVRRLYHDLSPGDVEDLGLTKALGTLIRDFTGHVPQITWQVDLVDLEGLFSLPVQTIIYRIIQEALTNIGKHAHPTLVTISAKKEPGQVHFVVQDNGIGFDPQELSSRESGRGVGLVAMEERLNMIGGSFEIHSRDQEGTRLTFAIPTFPEGRKTMTP